jgi:hypothetical protein
MGVAMRYWLFVGLLMTTSGCDAKSGIIKFSDLNIPEKYVLHAPSDGPKGVFDDKDINIALVLNEDEIKEFIPQYLIEKRGTKELSIVINKKAYDLNAISNSILSSYEITEGNFSTDKYSPNKRLYRYSDSWLMVTVVNNQPHLVAQCRKSGLTGDVEICDFKKNVNGYGISYHLENDNISLAEEFEKFVLWKIERWKQQ